jgi:hypothetical protein
VRPFDLEGSGRPSPPGTIAESVRVESSQFHRAPKKGRRPGTPNRRGAPPPRGGDPVRDTRREWPCVQERSLHQGRPHLATFDGGATRSAGRTRATLGENG